MQTLQAHTAYNQPTEIEHPAKQRFILNDRPV